ncbi:MAG: hypothetical protein ACRENE_01355 [Polyangiaceae bacterium]
MTTVLFGSNRFVDCSTLIASGGQAVLRVLTGPLRVTLATPPNLPSGRTVKVSDNVRGAESSPKVQVVKSDTAVAIFWDQSPLVIATQLEPDVVSLRADLRSVGINIFDDAAGLHVGGMQFRNSGVVNASVAFQLG